MKFLEQSFDKQNQFWKYIVVILAAFCGGQIFAIIPVSILAVKAVKENGALVMNPDNPADFSALGLSSNMGLLLTMSVFVVIFLLAILLIKAMHKRSFAQTVNGTRKVRIKRCLTGAAVWGILLVIYYIADYLVDPGNYRLQFDLSAFIPLFFISVLIIPFQTTCEEFLCRGYLAQGLAGWTKSRWVAIIVPSLLFGLLHSFNPEIKEFGFWVMIPQYVFFGILFALISVLDDGIELAIGMHAVNNILSSLLVTHQASALQTSAIFEQFDAVPLKEMIILFISGAIAFAVLARKYKWNFKVLNQKLTPVQTE